MYSDQKKRKGGGLCALILIAVILAVTIVLISRETRRNGGIISPIPDSQAPASILDFVIPRKNPDELKKIVKQQIGSTWNNYSVLVSDFTSPFTMGINETTIFTGASLNKVPILAALYDEAQKGNVDFDKIITLQADDIQDYGTGSIRYDPPGTTYSIKTLARLTGQESDNTAAHILGVDVLSMDLTQRYVNDWGMIQTDMVNNKTSNQDMALLFRKIVNGQIVNNALSQELLGFLKDSDFEDRIPALLPKDVTVYHKVGTGPNEIHDVGVVVRGKTKYYIGIMTENITDVDGAATLSAQISKDVFDYMTTH